MPESSSPRHNNRFLTSEHTGECVFRVSCIACPFLREKIGCRDENWFPRTAARHDRRLRLATFGSYTTTTHVVLITFLPIIAQHIPARCLRRPAHPRHHRIDY